ncbi:hypothetical protein [Azospirillum largimobile]
MANQTAGRPPADDEPTTGRPFHGAAHGAGAGGSMILSDLPHPDRRRQEHAGSGAQALRQSSKR